MIKIILIPIGLIFITCTSNPFWNDPGTSELLLHGKITIEDNNLSTPALVWMEGSSNLNNTDQYGSFSLRIINSQLNELSMSGPVKVFFFIYNYQLDSAIINFTNGRFSNNQSDFSQDGELMKPIFLKKIISGDLQLILLDDSFYDQEIVHLTFNNHFHSNASLEAYKFIWEEDTSNFFSGLIFQNISNDSITLYRYYRSDNYGNIINDQLMPLSFDKNQQTQWNYFVNTNQIILSAGEYKILPYFRIQNQNLPSGMIDLLGGEEVFLFSKEFTTLPMNIIHGSVEID